jgi:hypothetical protein
MKRAAEASVNGPFGSSVKSLMPGAYERAAVWASTASTRA